MRPVALVTLMMLLLLEVAAVVVLLEVAAVVVLLEGVYLLLLACLPVGLASAIDRRGTFIDDDDTDSDDDNDVDEDDEDDRRGVDTELTFFFR